MTVRMLVAALAASISSAAVAHEAPFVHTHPHGANLILFGLGVAALVYGAHRSGVIRAIRNRNGR